MFNSFFKLGNSQWTLRSIRMTAGGINKNWVEIAPISARYGVQIKMNSLVLNRKTVVENSHHIGEGKS